MKTPLLLLGSSILLAIPLRADVQASFAGRLVIDSPVRLALEAKGALAPWRTMTTSGTTERADGTREFAMAVGNAPKISGEFRVSDECPQVFANDDCQKLQLSTNDTKINVNPAAKDFALSAALREEPPFRVFALSPTGARLRAVPSSFDAATGILRFTADTAADPASATYLYEIVRE